MTRRLRGGFAFFRGFLHADSFARAFARARVGARALSAHRQSTAMAQSAIAVDRLQAFQISLYLAAQITFDWQLARCDRMNKRVELLGGEILRADVGIDPRLGENFFRGARTDAVDVGQ